MVPYVTVTSSFLHIQMRMQKRLNQVNGYLDVSGLAEARLVTTYVQLGNPHTLSTYQQIKRIIDRDIE